MSLFLSNLGPLQSSLGGTADALTPELIREDHCALHRPFCPTLRDCIANGHFGKGDHQIQYSVLKQWNI
jgi:hypothetical protein